MFVRAVNICLLVLLLALQARIWIADDGLAAVHRLEQGIAAQKTENAALRARNQVLDAEVLDLKSGLEMVEERARRELGMIRRGETFYQLVAP
ncbi:MAG: cell division protein FtsB [Ectothiorhodospiraceae bacterium]|nr:cell division protein FtsB [Ectothiorhodospiraceae bacterium]